jgi:hypothetical protein
VLGVCQRSRPGDCFSKIVEIEAKSIPPSTNMPDLSLSRLGTGAAIKSGGVQLVLWVQTSYLRLSDVGGLKRV